MRNLLGLEPESEKLRNLDFLRFLASCGIVVYHSHEFFFAPAEREALHDQLGGLGLFVDLFFIISGFVMGFVYQGRIGSPTAYFGFLWRRVARLYPLHFLVLALNVALWAVILTRADSANAPSFDPRCIAVQAFLLQEFIDCGSAATFNGVTWSVSVEMGLYALALPLLMLVARLGSASLVLGAGATLLASLWMLPDNGRWDYLPSLLRGLTSFTIGYVFFRVGSLIPARREAATVVLPLSAVTVVVMLAGAPQVATFGLVIALAAVAVSADRAGHAVSWVAKLCPLGQLTYGIYLWHRLFILALLNVVADKLFHGDAVVLAGMAVLAVTGILVTSYLGYFLIERPARNRLIAMIASARDEVAESRAQTPGL